MGSTMKLSGVAVCSLLVLAVVAMEAADMAEAVTCNPTEMSPCLPAITSSAAPTSSCCDKVREQKPCLCEYLKNPLLWQYVASKGAKRVSKACGVPTPTCS